MLERTRIVRQRHGMDELEHIACTQGSFLRREALDAGYDDKALSRALRSGLIVRVRHGAYTFAELWHPLSAEQKHIVRAAAVVREARERQVLSHTTAALLHGSDVWDLDLGGVHVTRPRMNGGRNQAGVARHRGRLRAQEITEVDGITCTSPIRTALDVTTITDVEHALVVACSMLHNELFSKEDLVEAAAEWVRHPGSLTTDVVVRLADMRLESVGETRTLYHLWRQGIPAPTPQYPVYDERGVLVAELDFAWPERRAFLEFDGLGKYLKWLRPGEDPGDAVFARRSVRTSYDA